MVSSPSISSQPSQLSEELIQDAFHSYLKSSLTQAKAERLLDEELLSSAESDLMITGPALCLYFAALRCTTQPPSVPLPRSKTSSKKPMDLSYENCPPTFVSFLRVWAKNVPKIQDLTPEYQHDLARVICSLDPISQPLNISINGIAADLRGVAIEISQRRSFQNRYASDLQAALDAGTPSSRKASFVPPPLYEQSSPNSSPRPSVDSLPPDRRSHDIPPQSATHLSPYPSTPNSASPSSSKFPRRSPSPSSPTFLAPESPAIEFIRETLYASLADQLEHIPSLRKLLKRDPPRAYFGSVAFAILDVSMNAVTPEGAIVGVLGKPLALSECPRELRPFMAELAAIGHQAKEMEEGDNEAAMRLAERGKAIPITRMERVRRMLEGGIGAERDGSGRGRESVEGRSVAFANRVNSLSLALTKLKAFRERQDEVFKVLAGIGSF